MEITNSPEAAKYLINGFLIGLQCTLMLVFIIITIIDLKNAKKQWKQTDDWIKSIELQHKFESTMADCINNNENRISNIEEKLGIKEEENE